MYNDPLLNESQNQNNRLRLQSILANSTIKLVDQNTSNDQFSSELLQHCSGLRALESYEQPKQQPKG